MSREIFYFVWRINLSKLETCGGPPNSDSVGVGVGVKKMKIFGVGVREIKVFGIGVGVNFIVGVDQSPINPEKL